MLDLRSVGIDAPLSRPVDEQEDFFFKALDRFADRYYSDEELDATVPETVFHYEPKVRRRVRYLRRRRVFWTY